MRFVVAGERAGACEEREACGTAREGGVKWVWRLQQAARAIVERLY